jgi:hypothetical protein
VIRAAPVLSAAPGRDDPAPGEVLDAGETPGARDSRRRVPWVMPGGSPPAPASVGVARPAIAGGVLFTDLGGPRLARVIGLGPRLRWSRTTGTLMASPAYRSGSAAFDSPLMSLERDGSRRPLLEVGWWPSSTDLAAELRALVSVLEEIRGPVNRLLLGVGDWAARPHQIVTDGRTVTIGYLAGQPSWMVTALCADGGTFSVRVTAPGSEPGAPHQPETGPGNDTWEAEGGGLGPLANRTAHASI